MRNVTLKVKHVQVLTGLHRDRILMILDAPKPYPALEDSEPDVQIDVYRGYGVEWLKQAFDIAPDEVIDAGTGKITKFKFSEKT